ncbi:MAG TPA: asparagine synthetase B, partial [Thioploca sp.]|nr:asparagine synthetase B [Thioploca sp.]
TIYNGVYKLLPGSILKISKSNIDNNDIPLPHLYWSLHEVAMNGQKNLFLGTTDEAQDQLECLLTQSISGQMISDVPLGAFLSGGIDSSTVLALMQKQSTRPIKTFTVGFYESDYNEAKHARAVANYLGTEHTELYVNDKKAIEIIPNLHQLYDEPFADSSQIPMALVSELARQHVTVSLSGDGGDELFGGYNRYLWGPAIWRRIYWMPRNFRAAIAGILTSVSPEAWDKVFSGLNIFLPKKLCYSTPGDKLHKLADILAVKSAEEIYEGLIIHWKNTQDVVKGNYEPITKIRLLNCSLDVLNLEHNMMYMDSVSYLPDDILVKVDRAAMGVSLETRIPFLDHRLVEFAWSLPLSMKVRDGQGKWLIRRILEQHVPSKLIDRPKMGFSIPLDSWLRGPLKPWAEKLLDESRLLEEGYFNSVPIRTMWLEHLSKKRNWSYHLWDVLMFQSWNSAIE